MFRERFARGEPLQINVNSLMIPPSRIDTWFNPVDVDVTRVRVHFSPLLVVRMRDDQTPEVRRIEVNPTGRSVQLRPAPSNNLDNNNSGHVR